MTDSQPNLRSESERSKSSRLHSHKQLWVIATINFLVLGIIIFALVGSRQQELDKAANTLESVSRSIDDVLSWRFEKINLALLGAVDEAQQQALRGDVSWECFEAYGKNLDERLPDTLGFLLTNTQGRVVYASPRALSGEMSITNTDHFVQLRNNPSSGLVISPPFYSQLWTRPIIVLSMRYLLPDGSFGGVVACAVSIDMFSDIMASAVIVGSSAVATLWDKKLGLVTQYPRGRFWLDAKPSPPLRKLIEHDAAPSIYQHRRADFGDKKRIAFYRKLSQWPLYLSIGLYEQAVLAKWRQDIFSLGFLWIVCVFISFWSGISYTRQLKALELGEKRYKGLFDNMQAGMALCEPVFAPDGKICDFRLVEINQAYCDVFKAKREDVIGKTLLERISPKTSETARWVNPLIVTAETGDPSHFEFYLAGNNLWADIVAYRSEVGIIAFLCTDISERKFAQARANRISQMYAALSRCNQAIVRCSGRNDLFAEVCRAAVEAGGMKGAWIGLVEKQTGNVQPVASFGLSNTDLQKLDISVWASDPKGSGPTGCAIRNNESVWSDDTTTDPRLAPWWQLVRKTGFLSVGALPLRQRGEVVGNLTLYADDAGTFDAEVRELLGEMALNVSFALDNFTWEEERRRNEARINELAYYDQLTGLANRPLLTDRIRQAVAVGMRTDKFSALLFIDLDRFKTINDTLGHAHGDNLLKQVGQRLLAIVPADDTVARFGGDEFVLLLHGLSGNSEEAAEAVALICRKILNAVREPILVEGITCNCTASIGVALFGKQSITPDELLKQADLAMYQAKDAGRNTVRFFDPAMQQTVMERIELERDLEEAIRLEQFVLYYQPLIDLDDNVFGAEALIRWQHPKRGIVSPADFIPLAEENGMIARIGAWVVRQACSQLGRWAVMPEFSNLTIAINVSARQFRESDFVRDVTAAVRQTGIDPSLLKLELTESQLAVNMQEIISSMVELSNLGIRFSLDDFGTGYSSMAYLKLLPLDQLKIDRSFIRDLLTDPNDAAIASIIIALSQSLGLTTVAEGVETREQKRALLNMGCTLFQGYLFSVPLAVKDFERYLARRNAAAAAEGHGNRAEQPESAEQTESTEQVAEGEGRGAA
ncbi:EAL domain-containing protein [Desulfovibrio desulfuricans]|uniref:EAL domain-containing protein n=1 Tax=Desulfovibrio desulfuricans TaxID=876 RepID=UPI00177E7807|nr:EAL domain-containing protein [Desulfovibrio desulfuricans]MBD8895077.1 EAL domain-containing protein [Desulfovibrio desulfuricans]